ncbi:hypothetical protein GGI35DRAFT_484603 [Trichoderma velutinum]
MSGADPIGIISSIITIVNASVNIYQVVEDIPYRLRSIRDLGPRLKLVLDTLEAVKASLEEEYGGKEGIVMDMSRASLIEILNSCSQKAVALQKALKDVTSTEDESIRKRFLRNIRLATSDKINKLVKDMLLDLKLLGVNHSVKAATGKQVKDLAASVKSRALEDRENGGHRATEIHLRNFGSGSQYVLDGPGNQNVVTGGMQFNGPLHSSFCILPTDAVSSKSGKTQAASRLLNFPEETEESILMQEWNEGETDA